MRKVIGMALLGGVLMLNSCKGPEKAVQNVTVADEKAVVKETEPVDTISALSVEREEVNQNPVQDSLTHYAKYFLENPGEVKDSASVYDFLSKSEDIPVVFEQNLDSVLYTFFASQLDNERSLGNVGNSSSASIPDLSDSIYIQRLADLNSPIIMPYNKKVKSYIDLYAKRRGKQVEVMLGLGEYYYPLFEEALDAAGLPLELKYLPVIESALNPRAFSPMGASGLWQFMYGTGKMYGLTVNSYIDERQDPVKSTQAAVEYLKDMYAIYGDWFLVIAAYNCGPGNVNKAIRRSGGKRDYWEIYYRLPRETRGYVPAFIAANYIMKYYKEHGLKVRKASLPLLTDTINIHKPLHLNQVASVMGMKIEQLRELNPQYRRDVVPARNATFALRLPFEQGPRFIELQDSIFAYKSSVYFDPNKASKAPSNSYHARITPKGRTKITYKVRSGDNVGFIATWFHVRTADLRYWNNIRRNLIRVGQNLVIYVPKDKAAYYKKFNSMSYAQKQASVGKKVQSKTTSKPTKINRNFEYYTVRRGDNLWSIARRYPGISSDDIKRLNGLGGSGLKPGQKLKIKVKS